AFKLVHAHLSGQVDREGLGDRHHARIGCDLFRIADPIDRQEQKMGIVVDEVVEPPRAQAVAGDDAARGARLTAPSDHTGLDELDYSIGYDIAMDAEISVALQMAQGLIGNAPEPDLQGRAVLYDRCDVARDALRDFADLGMPVFRHGRVDL